jgi:hypothetical protein
MAHNSTRHGGYDVCTQVSALCPVKATTLGYYPNKGVNIFIAICFAIAAVVTLAVGIRKKTWGFMSFIAAGCILELAGLCSFSLFWF